MVTLWKERPAGTTVEASYNTSARRFKETTRKVGFKVPNGQILGTTEAKGFKVHKSYNADTVNKVSIGPSTIPESQDGIISINEEMMVSADKRIAQQIRFDSKPLAIGMCYCCGSIFWSWVDNSHTSLVDINLTVEQIPAVDFYWFCIKENWSRYRLNNYWLLY